MLLHLWVPPTLAPALPYPTSGPLFCCCRCSPHSSDHLSLYIYLHLGLLTVLEVVLGEDLTLWPWM